MSALPASGNPSSAIFADSFESATPPGPGPSTAPPFAVRLFNKCAYGPRPNDIAAFNALGSNDDARLDAWLTRQLNPDAINDNACQSRIAAANYSTLGMSLQQLWATHQRGDTSAGGPGAWPRRYYPCEEAACLKLVRAVYSERQLYEVIVDFWHNHFNVQGWEYSIAPVFMHYDRDVIRGRANSSSRPYALGNFRQLLEQVARATAMMLYLNNKSSKGSNYNENFARELCELHTLGAEHYYPTTDPNAVPLDPDGVPKGYCDNDVYEAARALTGWTIEDGSYVGGDPERLPDTGLFRYWPGWHDKAGKLFLGHYILPNRPALHDGQKVMDLLCQHIGTARHICRKLCMRFISDTPPQSLVESAAAIWKAHWQAPDQIAKVLRHILTSTAFKTSWAEKTKRPWEAFMHALRATSAELTPTPRPVSGWTSYTDLLSRIEQSGNGPFRWPTPDGYPDINRKWQAVSPLAQTWRTLSRMGELRRPGSDDNNPQLTDYFERINQITEAQFPSEAAGTTVNAVVDFWIRRIYGYAIKPERRERIVRFLGQRNTAAAAGVLQLRWDNVWSSDLARNYTRSRLRAAVALLMMSPEFYHR